MAVRQGDNCRISGDRPFAVSTAWPTWGLVSSYPMRGRVRETRSWRSFMAEPYDAANPARHAAAHPSAPGIFRRDGHPRSSRVATSGTGDLARTTVPGRDQ